jgi:hypothetical protein
MWKIHMLVGWVPCPRRSSRNLSGSCMPKDNLTGTQRKSLQATRPLYLQSFLLIKAIQPWCSVPLTVIRTFRGSNYENDKEVHAESVAGKPFAF